MFTKTLVFDLINDYVTFSLLLDQNGFVFFRVLVTDTRNKNCAFSSNVRLLLW